MMDEVPENINFPKEEEKVLQYWKEIDAFRTSLKQSKSRKRFTFYDGPPFATGLPHYGHILAGTIKDIVPRYAHMTGHHVERRFGWDTHGLPVEYEMDKILGITGPSDVMAMGIDKYNAECRKLVMRYSKEWEEIIGRLGRWIDFQNDYKTLYPWFMESVWWVFSELWKKGMVYKGVKVMAFSTACSTPLSNFESNQNYKDVVDPAVIIGFPLLDDPDVSMIAWTTTPWTLPSNLALCVNPAMDYVKVRDNSTDRVYIMMEARLVALFKKPQEYTVIETFKGETLKGKAYKPLFNYFEYMKEQGAFRVLVDSFVTSESGTGVVHQAPYFGEDDYRVCLNAGVITEDQQIICPVDETGCFMAPVTDYQGQYIKDADKQIIKELKANGRLIHQSTTKHSYPFCWRSETPLIYKAVPCWFIRVAPHVQKLLASNEETYWVPAFVKEKRFANWLTNARDWAVSRNRYWGTPIPIWSSEDGKEMVCVGSIEELHKLSGVKLEDLHREYADAVTIPSSREGHPPLRRISEVFDCWFEAGSMPYAQAHYPFERKNEFEENFPADFIAEGIDQTRGWFYTLLVISTSLFNKPPFKNLIVNGLVLAKDGQKMSKSKKNYPDPMHVVNKYGADSLRMYLINSPVVRAENLRFKEEGVKDILKEVMLPWYNAYRFFAQNVFRFEKDENESFRVDLEEITERKSENTMDRWIMSFTQSLLSFVKEEMAAYRLYTVIPKLVAFVDNLTNWYVRTNRRRLKGEKGKEECREALNTLFMVLFTMVRVMAPFTPFITEHLYQNLRKVVKDYLSSQETESVHYLQIPEPKSSLIDKDIERVIDRMQQVVVLGRVIRDKHQIALKYPLKEMVVFKPSDEWEFDLKSVENYIKEELNIRSMLVTDCKDSYGVELKAQADIKQLGPKVKDELKKMQPAIRALGRAELEKLQRTGHLQVNGFDLVPSDLIIKDEFVRNSANERFEGADNSNVLVLLDKTMDQEEYDEGTAKEICNRIQKLRKKAHLVPTDEITVYFEITPADCEIARVSNSHVDMMEKQIKCPLRQLKRLPSESDVIIQETFKEVKDGDLELVITRGLAAKEPTTPSSKTPMLDKPVGMPPNKQARFDSPASGPSCRYVNVKLCDTSPRLGAKGTVASILLENPVRSNVLDRDGLVQEISRTFGLSGMRLQLYLKPDRSEALPDTLDLDAVHAQWLYVFTLHSSAEKRAEPPAKLPLSRFVNVEFGGKQGTVMLENPVSDVNVRQLEDLLSRVIVLFDISSKDIKVSTDREQKHLYNKSCSANDLSGRTVYVSSS